MLTVGLQWWRDQDSAKKYLEKDSRGMHLSNIIKVGDLFSQCFFFFKIKCYCILNENERPVTWMSFDGLYFMCNRILQFSPLKLTNIHLKIFKCDCTKKKCNVARVLWMSPIAKAQLWLG